MKDGTEVKFYIFHNATVQSAHDSNVFTSPDIVVADVCTLCFTDEHYETKKKLSYLANRNVITFCEAKNFAPFPELMINFVGTVNELKPKCLSKIGYGDLHLEDHIAPSMMMSGSENKPCKTIRISLESRYWINFFDDLFDNPLLGNMSVRNIENITTFCKKGEHKY
ncbi:MAG: hypothetical protein MJ003_05155 [Paludibacteraceae bacterium]|nr:hypothetical protein [Paludibacteraceae bacterium]